MLVPRVTVTGRSVFARSVKHGNPKKRRLFLNPARVSQDRGGAFDQTEEGQITDRLKQAQPVWSRNCYPVSGQGGPRAGMHREHNGHLARHLTQSLHCALEERAVDQRRAVQRDDQILPVREPKLRRDVERVYMGLHHHERVDHRVADLVDLLAETRLRA